MPVPERRSIHRSGVLIPVDHEPIAQGAVEEAFFLAAGLACKDVQFKLLHGGTDRGMPTLFLPHHSGYRWDERMVNGDAVAEILREAARGSADLIVFATQGHRGILDALRGSTTERVLHRVMLWPEMGVHLTFEQSTEKVTQSRCLAARRRTSLHCLDRATPFAILIRLVGLNSHACE